MNKLDENRIENFIVENKDKFSDDDLKNNHEEKFLFRLKLKVREYINILPYLIKVLVLTIIIFVASIIIWNNYLRKDRDVVNLKQKIVNIISLKNNK